MQTITLTGGNLFQVANRLLGDATQWTRIAVLNGIDDPWLSGITTLTVPDMSTGSAPLVAQ